MIVGSLLLGAWWSTEFHSKITEMGLVVSEGIYRTRTSRQEVVSEPTDIAAVRCLCGFWHDAAAESDHTLPLPSFGSQPSGNPREVKVMLLSRLGIFPRWLHCQWGAVLTSPLKRKKNSKSRTCQAWFLRASKMQLHLPSLGIVPPFTWRTSPSSQGQRAWEWPCSERCTGLTALTEM